MIIISLSAKQLLALPLCHVEGSNGGPLANVLESRLWLALPCTWTGCHVVAHHHAVCFHACRWLFSPWFNMVVPCSTHGTFIRASSLRSNLTPPQCFYMEVAINPTHPHKQWINGVFTKYILMFVENLSLVRRIRAPLSPLILSTYPLKAASFPSWHEQKASLDPRQV